MARNATWKRLIPSAWSLLILLLWGSTACAGEADLAIPDLSKTIFKIVGQEISGWWLLLIGSFVICGTLGISLFLRWRVQQLPAHKSQLDIAEVIFQTCKTYLIQQGKFLLMLWVLIAIAISYYLLGFSHEAEKPAAEAAAVAVEGAKEAPHISPIVTVILVLIFSLVGMGGSYWVAWYGIRVNTFANCRTAFAALRGQPLDVVNIPLQAGMSIGLFLISL